MEREIKFRGWHKKNEEMVYPSMGLNWSKNLTVGRLIDNHIGGELMQYTGLKDRNGEEIYEGDIIVKDSYPYFDKGNANYIGIVEMIFGCWQYVLKCVNIEKAGISKWRDSPYIVYGILEYEKRGQLVAGYYEHKSFKPEEKGWFLFDCVTGKAEDFRSEQLLTEACEKRRFSPPIQMKTILENWTLYWDDPNRRRK